MPNSVVVKLRPILLAAKQLGRKAVGIEQSQKYCDIAIKRLAQMEMFYRKNKKGGLNE